MPRPRQPRVRSFFFLVLMLLSPALGEEYRWPAPVTQALLAPSDRVNSDILGACLQGGLIDLRYGQASIDVGGAGLILDWNDSTVFTINGAATDAKALAELVKSGQGLTVALRYDPSSGYIGWCDALSSEQLPAISLDLAPWAPILAPGETLAVTISPAESARLALKNPTLFAPGMAHQLSFSRHGRGWQAKLPIMNGWNWKELPVFVTDSSRTWKGKRISVVSSGPSIGKSGPTVASDLAGTIPGWFQLEGNLMFLDPTSIRIESSPGVSITEIFPRPDRVDFQMLVDGTGTFWIEACIADKTGRESRKRWSFSVRR